MWANKTGHLVKPGDKFSRLTVVAFSHNDKRWRRHYVVVCDCGNKKTVQGTLLRSGNTRSCGCLSSEVKKATRHPGDRGVINQIILQYRRHARDRGIDWNLSFDEVSEFVRSPCHYCGVVAGNLKITKNHAGFAHNGMDRKNRKLPYVADNTVACCGRCNIAKGTMDDFEFIEHCKKVASKWSRAILQAQGGEK